MKKVSLCMIATLILSCMLVFTGCGRQDDTVNPTPVVTPTPSAIPSVLPEIKDDLDPDTEDGIVKDDNGIITEGDTGTVGDSTVNNAAGNVGNADTSGKANVGTAK